ncbi:MAG: PKD domain-containing protein [Thermoplasmata archaeon]|nr:PKD domain-containing protein [Thermoplasmata archaeon]
MPAPLVWTNVSTLTGSAPGSLARPSMAYDGDAGSDLLFGGASYIQGEGLVPTGATWSYANGAWTELTPSQTPANASGATLAYDPSAGAFVLVSPTEVSHEGNPPAPTWQYANGDWSELDPTVVSGPPGTEYGAMVFDPEVNALVRFGGLQSGVYPTAGQVSNATWAFELGSWYNVSPHLSPPPLISPSMAYDPAEHGVVLFGGLARGSVVENQTWLWANWNWTQLTLPWNPPTLTEAGLAWDSTVGGLVLVGGTSHWGWGGTGFENNATYAFTDGAWTNLTPFGGFSGAVGAGLGYEPSSGGLLVYGGVDRGASENTTWLLDRAPAVAIVGNRTIADAGVPVGFSDPLAGAVGGQSIRWTFGDATSATGATASHSFAVPGAYSINLTGRSRASPSRADLWTSTRTRALRPRRRMGSARTRSPGRSGTGGVRRGSGWSTTGTWPPGTSPSRRA